LQNEVVALYAATRHRFFGVQVVSLTEKPRVVRI
jgi:hypothetical protein